MTALKRRGIYRGDAWHFLDDHSRPKLVETKTPPLMTDAGPMHRFRIEAEMGNVAGTGG